MTQHKSGSPGEEELTEANTRLPYDSGRPSLRNVKQNEKKQNKYRFSGKNLKMFSAEFGEECAGGDSLSSRITQFLRVRERNPETQPSNSSAASEPSSIRCIPP